MKRKICSISLVITWHHSKWPPNLVSPHVLVVFHYSDVIMGAMASQITSLTIVYSAIYLSADQRKHQSSASLAFVWGIHRWPGNSLHKGPVTWKMFPWCHHDSKWPQNLVSPHVLVVFMGKAPARQPPSGPMVQPLICCSVNGLKSSVFTTEILVFSLDTRYKRIPSSYYKIQMNTKMLKSNKSTKNAA